MLVEGECKRRGVGGLQSQLLLWAGRLLTKSMSGARKIHTITTEDFPLLFAVAVADGLEVAEAVGVVVMFMVMLLEGPPGLAPGPLSPA